MIKPFSASFLFCSRFAGFLTVRLLVFIFCLAFADTIAQAQNPAISTTTKVLNGKKYYIHKVAKGQSLYGIAKIYEVDLNVLLVENPEAIDGIKTGQELKIPTEKNKEQNLPTLKENTVLKIKEKEKEKAKTSPTNTVSTSATNQKNNPVKPAKQETEAEAPVELINKPKKSKYVVGLFLPFHFEGLDALNIDELVMNKQDFPASQQLALDIYEGLQQAADSLKNADFSIDFKLFDSGEIDSLTTIKLTRTEDFKNLDLIIGPLYNSPFKIVSSEAKKLQIPCVSPLTQQNKVLFDNVFTSKLIPANNTLLQGLADYCVDSISKQNMVLINNGNIKDQQTIKAFKTYYNQKAKDTLTEVRGLAGAKTVYKTEKTNYFIVLTENEAFISDFLTQLNMFADKKENIRVIGLRKWVGYDNLDLEYFNKFGFIYAAPYFVDEEKAFIQKLNTAYIQKYNTSAEDYYYLAADAGLYYFNLLKQMGSSFSVVLDDFSKKGTSLDFNFTHPNSTTGFENQSVQVVRYKEYKLKKAN